jgi:hypothetical protein
MEMQKKQDFLTTVKAAIATMIDVCGDNIYLLYETACKAAYQQGYEDGIKSAKATEAELEQQAADPANPENIDPLETGTEVKQAPVDGPENYRHALAEPGRTACGVIMPEILKLEMADGDRITCPKCLAIIKAEQE